MNNRVVFYGADSQVGTTMLAVSAARLLAKEGKRVLLIDASFEPVDPWYPKAASTSVDDLLPLIQSGSLTEEDIRQNIVTDQGIDILPGTRRGTGRSCTGEDLDSICSLTEKAYDWILADGGCGHGNGPSPAALKKSCAVLVLTQQEKCLRRFEEKMGALNTQISPRQLYAVNKFNRSGAFYTEKELAQRLGCVREAIRTVPYIPYGWQAELDRTTLLRYRSFRQAAEKITGWIKEGE